ncbi:MAG: hypothetical protein EXR98_05710 [Gemmataceae bacterium]|nr:hypothetical protein [Gemmataceae bacterium]
MGWAVLGILVFLLVAFVGAAWWQIRRRKLHRWWPTYLKEWRRFKVPTPAEEVHVILCIADHLETGCYADFTFPSVPSDTQPPIINRIYFCQRSARSASVV